MSNDNKPAAAQEAVADVQILRAVQVFIAGRFGEHDGWAKAVSRAADRLAAPVAAAPVDTWFADQLTAMGEVIPLASTPAAPVDGDAIERLQHAIEGECEGLGVSKETAAAILAYVCPAVTTSPVVAYMVDGRLEQGLTFDKSAAENMAMFNAGTVRPLAFADSTPAAPGIGLAALRDIASDLSQSAKVDDYEPQQIAFIESIRDRLLSALACVIVDSPAGGSDAFTVEGTVVFKRSEGAETRCVCCPDSSSHIYTRYVEWEGKRRPDWDVLELAILERVLYVDGNEGKRVRVTVDVLQATSAEVGS